MTTTTKRLAAMGLRVVPSSTGFRVVTARGVLFTTCATEAEMAAFAAAHATRKTGWHRPLVAC